VHSSRRLPPDRRPAGLEHWLVAPRPGSGPPLHRGRRAQQVDRTDRPGSRESCPRCLAEEATASAGGTATCSERQPARPDHRARVMERIGQSSGTASSHRLARGHRSVLIAEPEPSSGRLSISSRSGSFGGRPGAGLSLSTCAIGGR
jgi:hypothetical protein